MKSNEVAKSGSQALAVQGSADLAEWGETNEFSAQDIVIPKILLMQGQSEIVIAGKAKVGDLVDSSSGKVLGSVDKPLQGVVPFHLEKIWRIEKCTGKRYEYDSIEKITPMNETLPYEFDVQGQKFRRVYTFNYYVLVPGALLPYVCSFALTSAKAGKNLGTEMFVKNKLENLSPAAKTIDLGSVIEKGDDGVYAVRTIAVTGRTSPELEKEALKWFKTVRKGDTKVDEKGGF